MQTAPYTNKYYLVFASILILASIGLLNWWAPPSSDDFGYLLRDGISLEFLYNRYMSWSGRLVADALAAFWLGLGNHWSDAFNAFMLLALVWILSLLGQRLAGIKSWLPDARIILFIFILYWINNPKLGHTTIWIVGSANYLWTNVCLFGFALGFVGVLQTKRIHLWQGVLLSLFAVVAGCTNENTSVTVFVLLVLLTFNAWRQDLLTQQHKYWLALALLGLAIGIAALVLAPGDLIRAAHASNREWYDAPLDWRIWYHLVRRFPDSMAKYWEVALVLLIGGLVLRLSGNNKKLIWLLIAMACLANLIMVAAPPFPKRALQGGYIFMLAAAAIMAQQALQPGAIRYPRLLILTVTVCALQWLLSFGLMARAYYGTYQQHQVRVAILQSAAASGATEVQLPEFFFSKLLNSRDQFTTSIGSLGRYYGTNADISEYPVQGPYSKHQPPVPLGR